MTPCIQCIHAMRCVHTKFHNFCMSKNLDMNLLEFIFSEFYAIISVEILIINLLMDRSHQDNSKFFFLLFHQFYFVTYEFSKFWNNFYLFN